MLPSIFRRRKSLRTAHPRPRPTTPRPSPTMAQDHVSPDAMLTAKETKRLAHPARPLAIQAINTAGAEMDSPILVSGSPRSISSDASNWVMTMPTYPVLLEALETEHKVNRHQASQIDALQDKIDTLQTCLDDSHHQINSLEEALHLAHAEHSMVEHEKNRLVAHIEQLESQLAQQRRDMVSPASDISLQAPRRFDSQQRLGPQIDIPELISRHSSSMDISQLQQASLILDHEITARQSPHRPLRHRASFIPPSYPPLSMASSRNSSFMVSGGIESSLHV